VCQIALGYNKPTWGEALREFLVSLEARNRATKTVTFYRVQLRQLIHWASDEGISLEQYVLGELLQSHRTVAADKTDGVNLDQQRQGAAFGRSFGVEDARRPERQSFSNKAADSCAAGTPDRRRPRRCM
jgi:hypothetical protein